MNLTALMLVRNEAWCLYESARAALRWCHSLVILDHCSTDDTPKIIASLCIEYPGRIHWLHDDDPVFREMSLRQRMLEKAREIGSEFIAIIDADEMLTDNLVPTIRLTITRLQPGMILQLPWVSCWRSLRQTRDDNSIWSNNWTWAIFRDASHLHWESRTIGDAKDYDFHQRAPIGSVVGDRFIGKGMGGLLHFQHANWQRVMWKQLLYRLTEIVRWPQLGVEAINRRYGPTTDETKIFLTDIPSHWLPPELSQVDLGADPWQKAECMRLVKEHGKEYFAGIDFLGLDVG